MPTTLRWLTLTAVLISVLGATHPALVSAQGTCSSTTTIACGGTKTGSLGAIGETDCFQFTALTGEVVSILSKASAGASLLACWQLQDALGQAVGTPVCGSGERTLPADGTYTIKVFDFGNNQTGSYSLNMNVVSATASSCPVTTLACGEGWADAITFLTESDTYRFTTAATNEVVSITTATTNLAIQPCWQLYAADGSLVGTPACGHGERTLAAAGDYTIRVYEQSNDGTGAYQLDFNVLSATASSCPEGAMVCGDTFARTIDWVGDNDIYRIATAAANQVVSITTTRTSGAINPCWQLHNAAGLASGGVTCGHADQVVSTAGSYSIRVFDEGYDGTGSYDIALQSQPQCAMATATPTATVTATRPRPRPPR